MKNKLQQYFPMIRTKEDILTEIEGKKYLKNMFYGWQVKDRGDFLDFCTGAKGVSVCFGGSAK